MPLLSKASVRLTWGKSKWLAMGCLCAAMAAGAVAFFASVRTVPESAADRIGRLLAGKPKAGDKARLGDDVALVRKSLRGTAREVFDLAVALSGLERSGTADLPQAWAICQRLRWTRCERGELHLSAWVQARPADTGQQMLAGVLEDLVWNLGSPRDVREVLRPQKVPAGSSDAFKNHAALTRLRLAVVAETPDARAASLSEVCAIQEALCSSLPESLERVASSRPGPREYHLVAPPTPDQAGPPAPPTGALAPRQP